MALYGILNMDPNQPCPRCQSPRVQLKTNYCRSIGERGGYTWDQKTLRCHDCRHEWDGTTCPPRKESE